MSIEEDIRSWIEKGNQLFAKREIEPAEQLFERALRRDPCNEAALISLGMLYTATGRGHLAIQRFQRLQGELPAAPGPYRAIATLMRVSGKLPLALQYFQELAQRELADAKPTILLCLGEIYAADNNHSALRGVLAELLELPPSEAVTQGLLHLEISDATGLETLANQQEDPGLRDTLLGMAAEARNDFASAGQIFYQASTQENPSWYALNALAGMWLDNNQLDYCKAYLDQATALAPNTPEVLLTEARLLKARGDRERSSELFKQLIRLPGGLRRTRRLATVYARK